MYLNKVKLLAMHFNGSSERFSLNFLVSITSCQMSLVTSSMQQLHGLGQVKVTLEKTLQRLHAKIGADETRRQRLFGFCIVIFLQAPNTDTNKWTDRFCLVERCKFLKKLVDNFCLYSALDLPLAPSLVALRRVHERISLLLR